MGTLARNKKLGNFRNSWYAVWIGRDKLPCYV
jgi:hypothetical protein